MPRCYWTISSNPNSHKRFSYVYDVCILNAQFKSPYGFYSVYDRMYSLCAVYKPQRFLFCLSPYLFLLKPTLQQLFLESSYYAIKLKSGCSRLSILHIRLCLYSFYEATSSLRISHSPSFVFLLSEDSSRHSTYQTMLMILLVSYYHSAQNVCRPMTVAVCNNGIFYMPS